MPPGQETAVLGSKKDGAVGTDKNEEEPPIHRISVFWLAEPGFLGLAFFSGPRDKA